MTGEYTFVTAERQNELTRRIQQKLAESAQNADANSKGSPEPTTIRRNLAETEPATTTLQ